MCFLFKKPRDVLHQILANFTGLESFTPSTQETLSNATKRGLAENVGKRPFRTTKNRSYRYTRVFPKMVGFPPKSSMLIGFSIIFTIHFGGFPPIFGSTPTQGCSFGNESKPNPGNQHLDLARYHLWLCLFPKMYCGDKSASLIHSLKLTGRLWK